MPKKQITVSEAVEILASGLWTAHLRLKDQHALDGVRAMNDKAVVIQQAVGGQLAFMTDDGLSAQLPDEGGMIVLLHGQVGDESFMEFRVPRPYERIRSKAEGGGTEPAISHPVAMRLKNLTAYERNVERGRLEAEAKQKAYLAEQEANQEPLPDGDYDFPTDDGHKATFTFRDNSLVSISFTDPNAKIKKHEF